VLDPGGALVFAPETVEKVVRHVLRFGSSRADAEDLAQEALLVAWRERDRFDPARSLDAWLYGIARNVYRNHARRARRSPVDERVEPDDAAPSGVPIGDVVALHRAIRALPETQQDIVILHELDGHTLKATAALLAIPFDTAKDRLRRARATLEATCGAELDAAVAAERPATRRAANAVVASVLAGLAAAIGRQGTAAAAASIIGGKAIVAGVVTISIAIGAVAYYAVTRRDAVAIASVTRPPAVAATTTTTTTTTQQPQRPPVDPVGPAPLANPRASSADALAAEAKLVEDARGALRSGRPNDAIELLRAHARRFAAGQLLEECDLLWIEADVANGDSDDARARIGRFRAAYPSTVHAATLDELAARL
jgi:RNA polymerase sigma factor (sigma-70 family)